VTASWPPWLENLSGRDRIKAIVDAVARCYADDRPEDRHGDDGAQHCTAAVAVMLLEQVLVPEDGHVLISSADAWLALGALCVLGNGTPALEALAERLAEAAGVTL
jgi:hypothetical protein